MATRRRKPAEDRRPHVEAGDAVRVHEAYIEERLGGGEEPDAASYRRALQQFEQLPGAVRTIPPAPEPDVDEPEGGPS